MYQLPDATVLMFNMCAYTLVSQLTMSTAAAVAGAATVAYCIRLVGYPFGYTAHHLHDLAFFVA